MNKNEIKKELYKQKPIAIKTAFKGDYSHFVTQLSNKKIVEFHIPKCENITEKEVPAQLLIRWMV